MIHVLHPCKNCNVQDISLEHTCQYGRGDSIVFQKQMESCMKNQDNIFTLENDIYVHFCLFPKWVAVKENISMERTIVSIQQFSINQIQIKSKSRHTYNKQVGADIFTYSSVRLEGLFCCFLWINLSLNSTATSTLNGLTSNIKQQPSSQQGCSTCCNPLSQSQFIGSHNGKCQPLSSHKHSCITGMMLCWCWNVIGNMIGDGDNKHDKDRGWRQAW